MSNQEINWDDPASIEAALQQEGLGNIDIAGNRAMVHIGVGRAAMVAASGNIHDISDFEEDNLQLIDLDAILGE